jgi:hypothetical protein
MSSGGEIFWLKDPLILVNPIYVFRFFPTNSLTDPEKMNAIMRASLYISLALVLYTSDWKWLLIIVLTGIITAGYSASSLEGFRDWVRVSTSGSASASGSAENPYVDYLVSEMLKRKETRRRNINKINEFLYQDINDVYQKTQSQRSFAGTPGESLNDQTGFAKFLGYDSMRSCRDPGDQEQCYRGM